ncbi:hypothetical protein MMC12_002684 [Toensbergia leucococca]|nr:hypothetical protein [Toensbergia leucococca]
MSLHMELPRKLHASSTSSSSSSSSTATGCPAFPTPLYDGEPLSSDGSITLSRLIGIMAGSFSAVALLVSFFLVMRHATHLSNPGEQIKIIRIITIVPTFAVLSFLGAWFPTSFVYIKPWEDFYEAICFATLFLLLCTYISPIHEERNRYFAKQDNGTSQPGGNISLYNRCWVQMFQFPVLAFIIAIATDATQAAGVYCLQSNSKDYGHLWLNILLIISITFALGGILRFYGKTRTDIAEHKPLLKLLAFKAIVFLNFIQSTIFTYISGADIGISSKLSYYDLSTGIPSLLICFEMMIFSVFYHYAYSPKPYFIKQGMVPISGDHTLQMSQFTSYQGGFLGFRAITAAMNPMEVLNGIYVAFKILTGSRNPGYY